MPGYEFFGAEERKEVNDVLETGILMRYGFDGPRKGIWKAKELEQEPLFEDRLSVIARADHPLTRTGHIDFDTLAEACNKRAISSLEKICG